MIDLEKIRKEFPILSTKVHGKSLVYFDNAATTQKPQQVIQTITEAYETTNSNVHRGVHHLSQVSTTHHEEARKKVAQFIHANSPKEVLFTKGTTESINIVASCFGDFFCKEGDEIIISTMEHHSNIVPWQLLAERKKLHLKIIPMNDLGELSLTAYQELFTSKTKFVSVNHISNVLGTINPIEEMIQIAHQHNVPILIDGAQSAAHLPIDVQKLDADFYAFSGHKLYAPTGIGVLYGKEEWLNQMPPYQGGGEMIKQVSFAGTTYNSLPYKYEAGTPNYVGSAALATAIDYLNNIGLEKIATYEKELTEYATQQLKTIEGLHIYGEAANKSGVISFLIKDIHPFDMGTLLDQMGIAIRTGHHCAQPLMERLGVQGTMRISFAFYNTKEEIDYFVQTIKKIIPMFG